MKHCIICGKNPAEVPDRNSMSMVKKICGPCHKNRLRGDLSRVLTTHYEKKKKKLHKRSNTMTDKIQRYYITTEGDLKKAANGDMVLYSCHVKAMEAKTLRYLKLVDKYGELLGRNASKRSTIEAQAKEIERLKKVAHEFCDEIHEKAIEIERLNDSMHKINQWLEAYPVDLFPEPDLEKAHKVLKENGINLGAISASNFRHIIKGIKELTE